MIKTMILKYIIFYCFYQTQDLVILRLNSAVRILYAAKCWYLNKLSLFAYSCFYLLLKILL